jgi:hypothetical protein
MRVVAIFKGKTFDDRYQWENTADALPKQLMCDKIKVISSIFPKVNQIYNIWFKRFDGNLMIEPYQITEQYTTCGYWKNEGGDFIFKKGKNKGLTFKQVASAFLHNPELEKSFVKSQVSILKKTDNVYTKNNIHRIFNSGLITYCEVFGTINGSTIQVGNLKGTDITKIDFKHYQAARNRLEWFQAKTLSPITFNNCEKWIKYLDDKFVK